jgi:exodeoxyribonuclease VII large subunit
MIQKAEERAECDVLLLVRGGGSLEDLWTFNEECVAHAIYACRLPLVAGVGHETDFSIADLVADVRAPTPSAAAELVATPDRTTLRIALAQLAGRLKRAGERVLAGRHERLAGIAARLRRPDRRLSDLALRLDEVSGRLHSAYRHRHAQKRAHLVLVATQLLHHRPDARTASLRLALDHQQSRLCMAWERALTHRQAHLAEIAGALSGLSPLATLARGYAIVTTRSTGQIVRDAATLQVGTAIAARLSHGSVDCTVVSVRLEEPGW